MLNVGFWGCADRVFWSVLDTWNSVMTLPTDVKELIPEFYSDPSFLINSEKLNFGERAAGTALSLNTPPAGHTHIWPCGIPTACHIHIPQDH